MVHAWQTGIASCTGGVAACSPAGTSGIRVVVGAVMMGGTCRVSGAMST